MIQIITLISIIFLAAVDQLTKYIVQQNIIGKETIVFIPKFLGWHYTENTGASFSIFSGHVSFLAILTSVIIVVGIVLLMSKKIKFGFMYVGITLAISGGLGNLIDRILRGYVIDFIQTLFVDFAIFNFADCLICIGAMLIFVDAILDFRKKKNDG